MKEVKVEWMDEGVPSIRVSDIQKLVGENAVVFVKERDNYVDRGVLIDGIYIYERTFKS